MSTVRMCDKCGAIFSEREDSWQTFTATNVKRNRTTGRMETITEQLDACPRCAMPMGPLAEPPAPRLAERTVQESDNTQAVKELDKIITEHP